MRHTLGNEPKCIECFWYREKEAGVQTQYDGWCVNPHNLSHGINGRKREKPLEREGVLWNWDCRQWEDAEVRLTHFEVNCRKPEEWRTEAEKKYIMELLGVE